MNPDRLRRHRKIYAIAGQLKKAGHDGEQIKKDLAFQISNGRTDSSSALTDAEHVMLAGRMREAAEKAGIQAEGSGFRGQGSGKRKRRRLPPGVSAMRTTEQVKIIARLARRLGWEDETIDAEVAACKTSSQAMAKVEALKSMLVRQYDLVNEAKRIVDSPSLRMSRTAKEIEVLRDIVACGYGRNLANVAKRMKPGGILWALDIVGAPRSEGSGSRGQG